MTAGTLVFVATGTMVLVALVGGIWLEMRMLDPHDRQSAHFLEPAGDSVITRGRHRG